MATVLAAGDDPIKRVKESLPSMEGWVYLTHRKGALPRPREKHFIRLIHGKLYYYIDPLAQCKFSMPVRDTNVGRGDGGKSVKVSSVRRSVIFYTKTSEEQKRWIRALQSCAKWKLHDFYELGSHVGNVATSKVQTCIHIQTGAELAVKTVTRADRPPELVYNEMAIISQQLHPAVIHAVDILESADNVYLVQEYMNGGSLYDFIVENGTFTEQQARIAMKSILGGIKSLHDKGIVHRDLKPENILCASLTWPIVLKIADFGLAGFVQKNEMLKPVSHFIGTVGYAAPEQYEVPAKQCGKPVDIWAVGAILWNLLTATMPFPGENRQEIIEKSSKASFNFNHQNWNGVSGEAKDFIERCFNPKTSRRMTVEEAFVHEWMLVVDDVEIEEKENMSEDSSSAPNIERENEKYEEIEVVQVEEVNPPTAQAPVQNSEPLQEPTPAQINVPTGPVQLKEENENLVDDSSPLPAPPQHLLLPDDLSGATPVPLAPLAPLASKAPPEEQQGEAVAPPAVPPAAPPTPLSTIPQLELAKQPQALLAPPPPPPPPSAPSQSLSQAPTQPPPPPPPPPRF